MKWSAETRRAWYLGLIEAVEARRERERAARPETHRALVRKFVKKNPGCTYREISEGVGLTLDQVYGCALPKYQQFVRSSTPKAHWWAVKEPKEVQNKGLQTSAP
jgi:hypothetical protein